MLSPRVSAYLAKLQPVTLLEDANRPELDAEKAELVEVAHIGGERTIWVGQEGAASRHPSGGQPPVFVSFYTLDTAYEAHAERLRASLNRLELEHRIEGVPSTGSWERNCALKASFIQRIWKELGRPVVWLDADATVEAVPELLMDCGADFAVHKWDGWYFASGTIFFGATPEAGALIDRWALRCNADPYLWDQMHLDAAWADVAATEALITEWLPASYLGIFDAEIEAPIISHWQASRTERAVVSGGESRPKPQPPAVLFDARKASRFVRTPGGLFWGVEGIHHIKPDVGVEHPEGFDVPAYVNELVEGRALTIEVGCGVGRLAGGFAPDRYVGIDINPYALPLARAAHPSHDFRLITEELDYPEGDAVLFYTVLLHNTDDDLPHILARAQRAAPRLMICEVMDRRWRREGNPPAFNRDPADYVAACEEAGYRLVRHDRRNYERYRTLPVPDGRDVWLTSLVFDRA